MHNHNSTHQEAGSSDIPGYDDYRAIGQITNHTDLTGGNQGQRTRAIGLSLSDYSSGRDRVLRTFQHTDQQATQSPGQQASQSAVKNIWQ